MTRFMKQLIGIMVLLTLGVFIGMEITSSGIERIYGPIHATRITSAPDSTERYTEEYRDNLPIDKSRRVNGDTSVEESSQTAVIESGARTDEGTQRQVEVEQQSSNVRKKELQNMDDGPLPPVKDAAVNQLADKTAGVLQRVSQAGIKAVVGLFNGLF